MSGKILVTGHGNEGASHLLSRASQLTWSLYDQVRYILWFAPSDRTPLAQTVSRHLERFNGEPLSLVFLRGPLASFLLASFFRFFSLFSGRLTQTTVFGTCIRIHR